MTRKRIPLGRLKLRGLDTRPSQCWRGIRLVPLVRPGVRGDLRLTRRSYDDSLAVVGVGGKDRNASSSAYIGFIPHAFIIDYSKDGTPVAAFGTQLVSPANKRKERPKAVRLMHRMVKAEGDLRFRMLPLHLAMEGFLALHFGGPDVAWSEYTQQALGRGLQSRSELSVPATAIAGLAEAVRMFEIHDDQVGVVVYVADALASIFVVPHPEDYRALHRSILTDFFGELMYHYGLLFPTTAEFTVRVESSERIDEIGDLRTALARMRKQWVEAHALLASGLLERPVMSQVVRRAGPFTLHRFMQELYPRLEHHIGEAIVREDDGTIEYLKTYRLSAAQSRRAYLLQLLARHNWNLDTAAQAERNTKDELLRRLDNAGFGYLIKEHVLRAARRR